MGGRHSRVGGEQMEELLRVYEWEAGGEACTQEVMLDPNAIPGGTEWLQAALFCSDFY